MNLAKLFPISSVGITPINWEVKGIPYYAVNDDGSVGGSLGGKVDFGSTGGGYTDNVLLKDFWSNTREFGGNWYQGLYGVKNHWEVPIAQKLGAEGGSSSMVSLPLKDSQIGNPIGVYNNANVGPYFSTLQGIGLDWLNGVLASNQGVGIPILGLSANTGSKISFPGVANIAQLG